MALAWQSDNESECTCKRVEGVLDSPPVRRCPVCGKPLRPRQTSACSGPCRAALSRRRRAEGQSEKDRRVRELLEAALRVVCGTGDG